MGHQNVLNTIEKIMSESTIIRQLSDNGELLVSGGVYNLDTGIVEVIYP